MKIPITIATIIALEWSERIPAYVDETKTFVFCGTPSGSEIGEVYDCAVEMARARTDDLDEGDVWKIIDTPTVFNLKEIEFTEGVISIRWEQRL